MYSSGVFGGRDGHQAFSGPATMQAYAMSGQGRFLNPTPDQQSQPGALANTGLSGLLGPASQGGGIIGQMISDYINQQRQQQSGSGAMLRLPSNPLAPRTGGGLLGAY
jgi:hypothetical protein